MLLSTTLRLFLDGIGRREEYEFYLQKFHSEPGQSFAAVMPDLPSLEQSADLMAFDMNFLLRLELAPLVVLSGPEAGAMSELMQEAAGDALEVNADASADWRADVVEMLRQSRTEGRIALLNGGSRDPGELIAALAPEVLHRLHILRSVGGLRDASGGLIAYHWLRGHNERPVSAEDAPLLQFIEACLNDCPSLHVSVASPLDLLREMFTVKGRGTIVRPGSTIVHHSGLSGVDVPRLTALLTQSFGRSLARPESLTGASDIYLESRYRGAALLERRTEGYYLSKFAVGTEARGEGLAQEIWSIVCGAHPAMFWRARPDNPINGWYARQADGMHRDQPWTIFWRGVHPSHIPAVIEYCRARPADFVSASGN
ncbi:MAG: hypothetical protein KBA51_01400 [Kiritimatiellae bacterium]|nr:hypothetical protein [Kiritimatiellia bacterium]